MEKVKETVQKILPGHKANNYAAWTKEQGAKITVEQTEIPTAGEGEIIVKAHALAINPVDWKMQESGRFVKAWPVVLGCDVAGEVHEIGSSVTRFKKGDRVIVHTVGLATGKARDGAFQNYVAAPITTAAVIPKSVSYAEASVLPLALDTAAVGLFRKSEDNFLGLPLPSLNPTSTGKTIIVWGGASSVGSLAIQLAVASGTKVIAVASSRNHEYCKKLGATAVVDYKDPSVDEDVVKAVQASGGEFGGLLDVISEPASHAHTMPILEKLGGGNAAITLRPPESIPSGVKIGNVFGLNPVTHPIWEHFVTPALEQGKLKCVPEVQVVGKGLDSIQTGLGEMKKGVSAKKIVIEL